MILENVKMIDASPETVWSITHDVEDWPSWTPTVTSVIRVDDGPLDVGSLTKIKQPGLPACQWRVTQLTEGTGFTWKARVHGISMSATHTIIASETGAKSVLRLELNGIFIWALWPIVALSAKKSLERENASLKAACESVSSRVPCFDPTVGRTKQESGTE